MTQSIDFFRIGDTHVCLSLLNPCIIIDLDHIWMDFHWILVLSMVNFHPVTPDPVDYMWYNNNRVEPGEVNLVDM